MLSVSCSHFVGRNLEQPLNLIEGSTASGITRLATDRSEDHDVPGRLGMAITVLAIVVAASAGAAVVVSQQRQQQQHL